MKLPIKMPEVEHYQHVIFWFNEVGPATVGMAGHAPISYTEVANWAALTGTEISTFEVEVLMKMSKQYCYQSYISEDARCPPPFEEMFEQEELTMMREIADEKIRGLF